MRGGWTHPFKRIEGYVEYNAKVPEPMGLAGYKLLYNREREDKGEVDRQKMNDFTGGPGYTTVVLASNTFLGMKMLYFSMTYFVAHYIVRRRLEKKAPNHRLHIDGVSYYA